MVHQTEYATELFAELAVHDSRDGIKRALSATRSTLGIHLCYVSALTTGERIETQADASVISIPLTFSDGRVYGALEARAAQDEVLDDRDVSFLEVLAATIADQLEREEFDLERMRSLAESTGVSALAAAIEARDSYTGDHSRSVVDLARRVARRVGLDEREVEKVEQVALLHDVGKIAIPDYVLRKPGPLDDREWEIMRDHPAAGARMVRSIRGLSQVASAIRAEHERWDGGGYPDGLAGRQIPLASRITFVCDAYHAMTSDRPYRAALEEETALEELRRNAGSQFCPVAVSALISVLTDDTAVAAVA